VLQRVPEANLLVAGGICGALDPTEGPRVTLIGRMDSLQGAYRGARVVIAPILRGSGLKIKILEAVAFGCPVVTTSVGAEGYEDLRPELRVADDAMSFAASTAELLTDDRAEAQARAAMAQAAQGRLSPPAAYAETVALIRSLAAGPGARPNNPRHRQP
jgi:glycosyltransferase involved in cell wall biosynthesis